MPKPRRTSDATLVRRSQQGDRRAFSALLNRYDWRLRGLAHALLLDGGEMDAALATGYLRAWRDVVRVDPKDDVAAWLYRFTYNACIDHLRRVENAAGEPEPSHPRSGIAEGLASLPAAERVAVVLVDREGFSPASAARILGMPELALSTTLDAARERLVPHIPEPTSAAPTAPEAEAEAASPAGDDNDVPARSETEDVDQAATATSGTPATSGNGQAAPADGHADGDGDDDGDDGGADIDATIDATIDAHSTSQADRGSSGAATDETPSSAAEVDDGTAGAAEVDDGTAGLDEVEGGSSSDETPVGAANGSGNGSEDTDQVEDGSTGADNVNGNGHEATTAATGAHEAPTPAIDGHERDHTDGGNGNGNGATGADRNRGKGRRARRRAQHAAGQRLVEGPGGPGGPDALGDAPT